MFLDDTYSVRGEAVRMKPLRSYHDGTKKKDNLRITLKRFIVTTIIYDRGPQKLKGKVTNTSPCTPCARPKLKP